MSLGNVMQLAFGYAFHGVSRMLCLELYKSSVI